MLCYAILAGHDPKRAFSVGFDGNEADPAGPSDNELISRETAPAPGGGAIGDLFPFPVRTVLFAAGTVGSVILLVSAVVGLVCRVQCRMRRSPSSASSSEVMAAGGPTISVEVAPAVPPTNHQQQHQQQQRGSLSSASFLLRPEEDEAAVSSPLTPLTSGRL